MENGTTTLKAKTKEREYITDVILADVSSFDCNEDVIYIDDYISFHQMALIVDYLRQENKEE